MAHVRERLQAALAGRFSIEREIGQGGMAVVFLARPADMGPAVAMKVLRPEFARVVGVERFLREIAVLSELRHRAILPLLESGRAGDLPYYVMPYADGDSLQHRLQRTGPLPLDEVRAIATAVGSALDYAHARNLLHRDIKPANILFAEGRALLADFGVTRAIIRAGGESRSSSGIIVGTPEYMSPEQAGGDEAVDARSDLYALGCVVYEMLTGEPPFTGATAQAVLARHVNDPARGIRVVRAEVPAAMELAVLAALAKRPAERPASVAAFVKGLGGVPD